MCVKEARMTTGKIVLAVGVDKTLEIIKGSNQANAFRLPKAGNK